VARSENGYFLSEEHALSDRSCTQWISLSGRSKFTMIFTILYLKVNSNGIVLQVFCCSFRLERGEMLICGVVLWLSESVLCKVRQQQN
jgi:hypothetical protein